MSLLLGQRIQERRKLLGWSQENLANETGLGKLTIQKIENGLILAPKATTSAKLDTALKVHYLYTQSDQVLAELINHEEEELLKRVLSRLNTKERMEYCLMQ